MSPVSVRIALAVALAVPCAGGRPLAATAPPATLNALSNSAARIFRGVCVSAEPGIVEYAGARIAATTYTFEVRDHLKGGGGGTVTFRQVGTPQGGMADLGRAAGLPVYAPGVEYVIFLLPESRARLTSPAGASRGALVMRGEEVVVPADLAGLAPSPAPRAGDAKPVADSGRLPYQAVRVAILNALGAAPPGRP